jgi:RNA polymerase sigma-70 factor (ECF subfamily)
MNVSEANEHADYLYRTYHGLIYDYLYRMSRNAHLADDLASETFERAMKALLREGAAKHENPTAWLRAIAKNLLTDYYRRAVNRKELASTIYDDDPVPCPPADEVYLQKESLAKTHAMLESLTPAQRDVVVLRTLGGYTTAETAELMGRTGQAVRSLRHKAMKRLVEVHSPFHLHIVVGITPVADVTIAQAQGVPLAWRFQAFLKAPGEARRAC